MLSGLANHLPYSKLIENEKTNSWATDFKPVDRMSQY